MFYNIENMKEINSDSEELTKISVRAAKEHNLKSINIDIPREKLIVITGISGSGKSSLAFDTLYAEGQRRYIECLSPYARQFLGMMKKPNVDSIEGLSPAISIEQKTISHNPRSTVGTVTEIYDYLRLLFAKIGIQFCVDCKIPVEKKSIDNIVNSVIEDFNGHKIQILAPIIRGRKGHYQDLFEKFMKQGFTKVRVDGEIKELFSGMKLNRYQIHNIELVIDRCTASEKHYHRIFESIELALKHGDDSLLILFQDFDNDWSEKLYSTQYTCPSCGRAYRELSPNMFSFNSPYGACEKCDGVGEITDFDYDLVIPDENLSISEGGIAPLGKNRDTWIWRQIHSFAKINDIDINKPIKFIDKEKINKILWGDKDSKVEVDYDFANGRTYSHKFIGLLPSLKYHFENTSSLNVQKNYEQYMSSKTCDVCNGSRLKIESLNVFIKNYNIYDLVKYDINKTIDILQKIKSELNEKELKIANIIINEIISRLNFLKNVGLTYISLNRATKTLSGGESQRIRLAAQIGSDLVGIMYVLDEPSIGLHQYDNDKLIESLKRLRDLGNSVIVVEHDKAMIEKSDYIIDIGPGAGIHGGEILFASPPKEIINSNNSIVEKSLTAQYLKGIKKINYPKKRRTDKDKYLVLYGARGNNLKNIDVKFPLGKLICITGLSGSGKSTLINDTLYPILSKHFYKSNTIPLPYNKIEGLEYLDKVIEIDQKPIGRTPRSNPATYTGLFTHIRDFFSLLPEARIRGYKPGRFSFNVKDGRCEVCQGGGIRKIEMNFLPDVYIKCDSCNGKRYNKETLEVKYKGYSISDVLDMTVEEALSLFNEIPKIKRKLKTLYDVGLGYITLGQQAPTLSGGEAQRVKLATELSKKNTGKTLYLLDEPTTGLHFEDIRILLNLLNKLVDKGNTVIIIEHNLDVIKFADWIIDLGPEGGDNGGYIVAEGTPEELVKNIKSLTGKYLKQELDTI